MYNGWSLQTPFSLDAPLEAQTFDRIVHSRSHPGPSIPVSNPSALVPPPTPRLRPVPLPPISSDNTTLNTLVTYESHPHHIEYDIRRDPSDAFAPMGTSHWLEESVTNPPSPKMVIIWMDLTKLIVVRPASRDLKYVTIRDLLVATHKAFRKAAQEVSDDDETWVPSFSM